MARPPDFDALTRRRRRRRARLRPQPRLPRPLRRRLRRLQPHPLPRRRRHLGRPARRHRPRDAHHGPRRAAGRRLGRRSRAASSTTRCASPARSSSTRRRARPCTVTAKVGQLDAEARVARIDLTVTFDGETVLGKAQVRVSLACMTDDMPRRRLADAHHHAASAACPTRPASTAGRRATRSSRAALGRLGASTASDWLLLGGGSNTVASDDGFDGTVIHVATRGVERLEAPAGRVRLRVQAGEPWDDARRPHGPQRLVGHRGALRHPGLDGRRPGAEHRRLRPGARVQRCSASSSSTTQPATSVRLTRADLGLGYRTSVLKRGHARRRALRRPRARRRQRYPAASARRSSAPIAYAQLADALGVALGSRVSVAELRRAVLALRASKGMVLDPDDPDSVSAGSFFTNPIVSENFARSLPANAPALAGHSRRSPTS